MSRILVIARREFTSMVATRAFLLTMILLPVMMLGGLVLLPRLGKIGGPKDRQIVVADGTGQLFSMIARASDERTASIEAMIETQQAEEFDRDPISGTEFFHFEAASKPELTDDDRLTLSERIREGELYAFVELPKGLIDSDQSMAAKYVGQDAAISTARRWLEGLLQNELRQARLIELGIDPQVVDAADADVDLEPTLPYEKGEDGTAETKGGINMLATMFVPFGLMMLMFLVIFMAAQPMLESAMEEKQLRIAELLLGSVSPNQLMTGKLLGNVAGSFVVFAIYGVGALIVAHYNQWDVPVDWSQIPWLIVFQVLGVLFFSSVFLTIGASVSELKEAQSLLMPVWLFAVIPMMVWFVAVRDPNGPVATTLSFFPPSAPLMMSLRMASGQTIPAWHAPVSAAVMLVATYTVVTIAGRIYRAGLLKSDSAASFAKLFARLRAAE